MSWFSKKDPFDGLSEDKKTIVELIQLMCNHEKTKISFHPENLDDYYITNKEKHYDIILDSIGIHITNTNHTVTERFDSPFINMLKKIVLERATTDANLIQKEIMKRKNEMFERMKNSLKN